MTERQTEIAQIVTLLAEHEMRWTTHGSVRLYDVIHCAGDCDWSKRVTQLMDDDDCHALHWAHVAEVIAAATGGDGTTTSVVASLRARLDAVSDLADHLVGNEAAPLIREALNGYVRTPSEVVQP